MKVFVLVLTVSILIAFFCSFYNENINQNNGKLNYQIEELPRILWPKQNIKQFINEICVNRTPLVIIDHPLFDGNHNKHIFKPIDLIKYFDDNIDINNNFEYKSNLNCPIFEYYEEYLPFIDIIDWIPPNNNTKLIKKYKSFNNY